MSNKDIERTTSYYLLRVIVLTGILLLLSGTKAIYADPGHSLPVEVQSSVERLHFIENRGQLDPTVRYYLPGRDKTLYFTPTGVTIALSGNEADNPERWVVKLDFVEGQAQPTGQSPTETVISYFRGSPETWLTGLPTYNQITYPGLWPGIDLVYTLHNNQLKYQFIIQPGADPALIQLAYRGATAVTPTPTGRLEVSTPAGNYFDDAPTAYQLIDGERQSVATAYGSVLQRDDTATYGFNLGDYNPAYPLILDPAVIVYAGFIGGSQRENGYSIAVDGSGYAYVTGETRSTADFPATVGPDLSHNGGPYNGDAFIAKVKADGSGLVYAGFIGGSGEDYGYGVAVDDSGNAYITGYTESSDFPVTPGVYDPSYNGGGDAFAVKVNTAGTALSYATYIGDVVNSSNVDTGQDIAVDSSGNAYVLSDLSFGPYGGTDTSVVKLNTTASALSYVEYIGGSAGDDSGRSIAVDGSGNAYVTGYTESNNFPTTIGAYDTSYNGGGDAFVAKVNAAGSSLVYATYLGDTVNPSNVDTGTGIAVDSSGNVYVAVDLSFGPYGGADTSVAKLNAAGSALDYIQYVGGSAGNEFGLDVAVDSQGRAYLVGQTASSDFTVTNWQPTSYDAPQEAFLVRVKADGSGLDYAGFLTGGGSTAAGVAVDSNGNAYVTGTNWHGSDFPATIGPDTTANGERDAFVVKVSTTIVPPPMCSFITVWDDKIDNTMPAVAYNPVRHEYLVVWQNDNESVQGRRIGADGTLYADFTVGTGVNESRYQPDIAYSSAQDEYLVVYTYQPSGGNTDIRAKRVSGDGSTLSSEINITADATYQYYPAVAYNSQNDEYLVVFQNNVGGNTQDIIGQRVRAGDGTLLSWRNIATGAGEIRQQPDVAYNQTRNEYLIAYRYLPNTTSDGDIRGKVSVKDMSSLSSEIPICSAATDQDFTAIAAGPNEYLVTWSDGAAPTSDYDIYARRVSGSGAPQGSAAGFHVGGNSTSYVNLLPAVAYGRGFGYLVSWQYDSSGGYTNYDVYARYVMPGQDSAAGYPFVVDDYAYTQEYPALACAPSGDCLLVEQDDYPSGTEADIRARLVTPYHYYLPLILQN